MSEFKFEVGRVYADTSVCDSEIIYLFQVVKRTAKTVTFQKLRMDGSVDETEKPILRRPAVSCNGIGDSVESCCPFGKYSMCAYLNADQTIEDLERLYKRAGMPAPDVISNQLLKAEPDSRIRCEGNVIYVDFPVAV